MNKLGLYKLIVYTLILALNNYHSKPEAKHFSDEKWHLLVTPEAPAMEVQCFQVLVAAQLHVRCQEPVV